MNQIITDDSLETGGGKHLDQIQAPRLTSRLELLRNTLRPTPHVALAMKGMDLFAKLEYVNPVGSIKDRAAYELKNRMDRRLRRIATEMEDFLAGGDARGTVNVCTRCGRIGEDGWAYCPACGHEMGEQPRREGVG